MAARVLGQSAPAAATEMDLYIVPAGKSAVCSTLAVCNRGTGSATYRIAVRPAGAALANQHYVAHESVLPGSSSDYLTLGIALASTDVVTVRASSADMSFSMFGDES